MADAMQPLAVSALSGHIAPGRKGRRSGAAGVLVQELRPGALATIIVRRGQHDALAAKVRADLGCELPSTPRRVDGSGLTLVWAGPGRWLAILPAGDNGFAAGLTTRLAGLASVIDQSHALVPLRLSGPRIRDTLAKGFTVDLHPRAFGPGDAAITPVSHITTHIWQTDADPVYEVAVARSLAPSFWHWLEVSAAEYGLRVEAASP